MEEGYQEVIKTSSLPEEEKNIFLALFDKLNATQASVYNDLREEIIREMKKQQSKSLNIWTALRNSADKSSLLDNTFFPVTNIPSSLEKMAIIPGDKTITQPFNYGAAFLTCPYEQIPGYRDHEYLAKVTIDGETRQYPYKLIRYWDYLNAEALLPRLAEQYHLVTPAIYSPFARRAVVPSLDIPLDQPAEIDLDLAANGLASTLLTGYQLVWNIKIMDCRDAPEKKVSDIRHLGDDIREAYDFSLNDNDYLYVQSGKAVIRVTNEKFYLCFPEDSSLWDVDLECFIISIQNIPREALKICAAGFPPDYIFANTINQGFRQITQPRAKADFIDVVNRFQPDGLICGEPSFRKTGDTLLTYDEADSYNYPYGIQKEIPKKNLTPCYVPMQNSANDAFFCDRVSYLLDSLNYFYPSFRWIGVTYA